jgi:hypothetical protein
MMKLNAPKGYWLLTENEKNCMCNGCGPGKWGSLIVPDKLWIIGVDFGPACDIHDYCYQTWMPKKKADNLFLENMSIIADGAFWGVRWLAHRFAFIYYLAVKIGGAGAYRNARR